MRSSGSGAGRGGKAWRAALGALLLLAAASTRAAAPAAIPVRDTRAVDHWGEEQGLRSGALALARSADGALWVGTGRGLARFDGTAFSRVRPDGLPVDVPVRSLVEDGSGDLWIGTDGGLGRLHAGAYLPLQGGPREATSLHRGRDGTLWVGTMHGLGRLDAAGYRPVAGEAPKVFVLGEDATGRLLAGTDLGLFTVRDGRLSALPAAEGGLAARVQALLTDRRGRTWVGTIEGLRRADAPGRASPVTNLVAQSITALAEDPDGAVWVATIAGGVQRLSDDGTSAAPREAGHVGRPALALLADGDGALWLGTGSGLERLRRRLLLSVTRADGLSGEVVWSVYADPQGGALLAGLDGAGLDRLGAGPPEPLGARWHLEGRTVTASLRARDGALWLAVGASPLLRVVGDRVEAVPDAGAPRTRVRGLLQASDGSVLVGTEAGLERHAGGRVTLHDVASAPPVRVLAEDPQGAIWVGGAGLARLEGPDLQERTPPGLEEAQFIMAILPDGDDLWLGNYRRGLQLWHQGKLTSFADLDPRFAAGVVAVLPDAHGALWVAQEGSLLMAQRSELRARAEGGGAPLRVLAFDERDGLPSTEFTSAGQTPAARTPDGRLWFGTVNGLVVVDPARLRLLGPPAPPQVERIFVDGGEVAPRDGAVRLVHSGATLELHLSSPTLLSPHRLQFRHRLADRGEAWQAAGSGRTAFYRGLGEGDHRIELEVSRDGVDWTPARAPLRIEVRPGLLERTWVRALLALLSAGLLLGAVAAVQGIRGRRLRRRAGELARLVEERTSELATARDQLEARVEERTAQLQRELAERERLERQLAAAQKLDSIGRLAGGVAHDLNNLLTVVLGCAATAQLPEASAVEVQEDLTEIQKAGERAAALTRQLLAFARRQILASRRLDLNDVVAGVGTLLHRLLGANLELVIDVAAAPCPVVADAGQLEQVLVNLAVNARDAMPTGGTLRVETAAVELPGDRPGGHPGVAAGPWVRLRVSDTGTGLSEEASRHLFEPFFTTKEKGKGTGLGLATCYGIVTQMGGHIWLESAPGRGTTVEIHLPRAEGAVPQPSPEGARPGPAPAGGGERVLVVEDEPQVRTLAARALAERGYQVLTAGDGEEALRVLGDAPQPVDLLLTDVIMPRMGGVELAARLAGRSPRTSLLFMSGYVDRAAPGQGVLPEGADILLKPFTPAALAAKVRQVLDGRRSAVA